MVRTQGIVKRVGIANAREIFRRFGPRTTTFNEWWYGIVKKYSLKEDIDYKIIKPGYGSIIWINAITTVCICKDLCDGDLNGELNEVIKYKGLYHF